MSREILVVAIEEIAENASTAAVVGDEGIIVAVHDNCYTVYWLRTETTCDAGFGQVKLSV